MCPERQRGFALPTAIFLLVVMALLAAMMVRISSASHQAAVHDAQGVRAVMAARMGIEAALYAVHGTGVSSCSGGTLSNIPDLIGFSVVWSCTATDFNENGNDKKFWQITSTATYGAVADPDFVERQLMATTVR